MVSNAEAEEVAGFIRGPIDKMVVDGECITVHYGFNEREESGLVVQLWLPGQDSSYLVTPRLRELCGEMREPLADLVAPALLLP